jgi:hypothetical protein
MTTRTKTKGTSPSRLERALAFYEIPVTLSTESHSNFTRFLKMTSPQKAAFRNIAPGFLGLDWLNNYPQYQDDRNWVFSFGDDLSSDAISIKQANIYAIALGCLHSVNANPETRVSYKVISTHWEILANDTTKQRLHIFLHPAVTSEGSGNGEGNVSPSQPPPPGGMG